MTMFGAADYSADLYDGSTRVARAAFPGAKTLWARVADQPDLLEEDARDSRVPHAFRSLARTGRELLPVLQEVEWRDRDGHAVDPSEVVDPERTYRLGLSWQDH